MKEYIEKTLTKEQLRGSGIIGVVSRSKRVRGGGARRGATIECFPRRSSVICWKLKRHVLLISPLRRWISDLHSLS